MGNLSILATLTIVSGVLSLLCLLILHFVSPEFKSSWRMVSEYCFGKHKKILTLFFILWGVGSILLAFLLWNVVATTWGKFGVLFVFVSGIGAFMGGLFDAKHKLHGLSFLLGVPTLPIGALIISYHLIQHIGWSNHQSSILVATHSIWMSLVLMAISMMLLFSGFKKAGISLDKNTEPPKTLPQGVIGINGYANRLLIICYIGWLILLAKIYLSL